MVLLLLGLACGCETTRKHQTFVFASDELEETFQQYYDSAPPESRAKLDVLKRDERVRIHFIRGALDPELSRGAASGPHDGEDMRRRCVMHPAGVDHLIGVEFDWDVVLDEVTRK